MENEFGPDDLPQFSPRKFWGVLDSDFVRKRWQELQHYLVELLTNKTIDRFTTCNLAIISHDGEWISLNSQQCRLRSLIKPKELRN